MSCKNGFHFVINIQSKEQVNSLSVHLSVCASNNCLPMNRLPPISRLFIFMCNCTLQFNITFDFYYFFNYLSIFQYFFAILHPATDSQCEGNKNCLERCRAKKIRKKQKEQFERRRCSDRKGKEDRCVCMCISSSKDRHFSVLFSFFFFFSSRTLLTFSFMISDFNFVVTHVLTIQKTGFISDGHLIAVYCLSFFQVFDLLVKILKNTYLRNIYF